MMNDFLEINLDTKPQITYLGKSSLPGSSHHEYRMNGSWAMHLYKGDCRLSIGGKQIGINKGMISFTPENVPSVYDTDDPMEYYCVHIKSSSNNLSHCKSELNRFPYFPEISSYGVGEVTSEFKQAIMLQNWQKERSALKIWDILWLINYHIQNNSPESGRSNPVLDRAFSIIDNSLYDIIYPGQVAEKLGVSLTHLNRLFNKSIGLSIGQYLVTCKLRKVLDQLKNTNKAIKLIAYESGFNNLQHFNKTCRKYFGLSPRDLRSKAFITDLSSEYQRLHEQLPSNFKNH